MHEHIEVGVLPAVAVGLVLWGMLSARFERWNLSGPMVFVAFGLLLGAGSDPVVELSIHNEVVMPTIELTLAVVLFGDAATVPLRRLEGDAGPPARLLVVGLPLAMAFGTLGAHLLLPGLSWWVCAVIGAAVAPTDAALGAAIVEDERVPRRIRQLLNVESGLNDGIATPFVNVFLVAAVVGTAYEVESEEAAVWALALGVAVGAVIGALSGRGLEEAVRRRLADPAFVPVATVAVAICSYATAVGLGANGFVAAFVAGLVHRAAYRGEPLDDALRFTHEVGTTLSLAVWFVFGLAVAGSSLDPTWREVAFALLALTVVRMVPVALALVGGGFDRATVGLVGWFGPRGLASVVFALLAVEILPRAQADRVLLAIGVTVLSSVVLHGITAAPLARRYAEGHPAEPG